MKQIDRNQALDIFREQFKPWMSTDDCMEFYSNRKQNGTETYLRSSISCADKLSAVILEGYSVKSKMSGNVILILPDPDYDIPVFTFQLGGNDKQSIALLDIGPTLPDVDYTPVRPAFDKFRNLLGVEAPKVEWVRSISSPCLLHCQYGELDEALFLDALREYLTLWIEHYYLPGRLIDDPARTAIATNAVYKYKHVLHDNDPAYGIFAKAWGKPVADAFFYLETSQHPALPMPAAEKQRFKAWKNPELNILWTREAQECVCEAPESVWHIIREAIEIKVAAANIGIITLNVWNEYKGRRPDAA